MFGAHRRVGHPAHRAGRRGALGGDRGGDQHRPGWSTGSPGVARCGPHRRSAVPRQNSPLNTTVSRNRRFSVSAGSLEDSRQLRARYDCDVNDVVLAVVAGALRNWLLSGAEPVTSTTTVRAMAPMSVYPDAELDQGGPGQAISEVSPFLVDLPVAGGQRGRAGCCAAGAIATEAIAALGAPGAMPGPSSRSRGSVRRPCTPWEFAWRPASRRGSSTC